MESRITILILCNCLTWAVLFTKSVVGGEDIGNQNLLFPAGNDLAE